MGSTSRVTSVANAQHLIVALGSLFIALALGGILLNGGDPPSRNGFLEVLLIVSPGLVLLYGAYRLPQTDIRAELYPFIARWCFAGFGMMFTVVVLVDLATGIDRPVFSTALATAIGTVGGLGMGMYNARAKTRAWEVEQRNRKLQRERNLREQIVETSPVGIAVIDADGTLSFANGHAAEIVGLPKGDLIGREFDAPMFGATDADGNPVEDGVYNEVLSTGESVYNAERQITRADGQRIWLSVNAAPLHNSAGNVDGVVFAAEDITERKERETALELFRNLIDRSNDAVFVIEPETGAFVDVNETACRRLGYDREDLLDLSVPHIEQNLPCQEVWHDHVDDVRTEGDLTFEGEHQRADGTTFPVEVNVTYITIDQEYMCAIARDVTERRKHKRQLETQNERLESFASMLAHELRNPVTIGQIYSQQLPTETDSEAVSYVAEAFDRIEDMIDVMLVLTRGREAVGECTRVNLSTVAKEAWEEVDAPEATLEIAIGDTIQADETYIRHLFRNLFENAVEHGRRDVTVTVGEFPTGFYVADDGPGIAADDSDLVFEAGYTTAADGGGTGLGLAFIQELADVYGWTCTVTESETGGAQFEFQNVDQDSHNT